MGKSLIGRGFNKESLIGKEFSKSRKAFGKERV